MPGFNFKAAPGTLFSKIAGEDLLLRVDSTESDSDVNMNSAAAMVVALESTVAEPRLCAVMLGQLIKGLGADHVVWGSDAIWTGAPQWQIEALRRLEIPEALRKSHNLPMLGAILLLAHDLLDLPEHAKPEWQERINPGALLPHHTRTQHQTMRDDFRLLWGLTQYW